MLKAIDVANFFLYLMNDEENDISNLKLNKLLYYAQGYSLKKTGNPLFEEDIEAWQHGPVVSNVYHKFKGFGGNPIEISDEAVDFENFSNEEKEIVLDVAREYGKYSAVALREMTHQSNTPWSEYYEEGKKSIVIPQECIEKYFKKYIDIKPFRFDISSAEEIGYRDSEGYLVLPKEYDS